MIILQTNLNPNPNPKKKNCELAMEDNTNNILENEATKRVRKKKKRRRRKKPGFRVGALVLSGALLRISIDQVIVF